MKLKHYLLGFIIISCLSSCGSSKKLVTTSVAYQSVRPVNYKAEVPNDAKIVVRYSITNDGYLIAVVINNTNDIMIIDQTKSFIVNSDGTSTSYYDPTVRVTSHTTTTSETNGASVNLGAIAGALGIGGPLGTLANGVNVGGANTTGYSSTNTTYFQDQPQISIGPKGHGAMSRSFPIKGLGKSSLKYSTDKNDTFTPTNSYCKFSACITFSTDGGNSFDKIVTDFYANSIIVCPVKSHGKVNDALRTLLSTKTDALNEPWWMLYFNSNIDSNNDMFKGAITDYR